uniref:Variant surface glycoprotein 1319 n=1 Tax=Trypanosoma brucei TaxID=5691 RepID=M4SZY1_9TRYP|nr:variant surface glycoprotein 1319 [Trypanosoma brucei]
MTLNRKGKTVVAQSILFILLLEQSTTSVSADKAVDAVTDLCSEIKFTENLQSHFSTAGKTLATTAQTLEEEARMLNLAAAKWQGTNLGAAYTLLTAIASERAAATEKLLVNSIDHTTGAALELASRKGQLEGLRKSTVGGAATYSKTAVSNPSSNLFTGSGSQYTISVSLAYSKQGKCAANTDKDTKLAKAAAELATMTVYRGQADDKFAIPEVTTALVSKGEPAFGTDSNYERPQACAQSATASATSGLGIFSYTPKTDFSNSTEETMKNANQCVTPTTEEEETPVSRKRLAAVLCNARQHLGTPKTSIMSETTASLIGGSDAQTLALLLQGADSKEKNEDKRENSVRYFLGNEQTDLKDKFFNPLETEDIALNVDGSGTKTSIKKAAQGDNYAAVLAYFTGQAIKKERGSSETDQAGSNERRGLHSERER